MQQIKLDKKLFSKVLSGVKTATTRKDLKGYTLGPAEFVNPKDNGDVIPIIITRLALETWNGIIHDSSLYHYEGYRASSDLDEALENIYGKMEKDQVMTVIYFKLAR